MNLLEIRQQFVRMSGRYDLANEDHSDNGANFFIKAGQKYLDRLNTYEKATLRLRWPVEQGQHRLFISQVRSIKHVWYYHGTERYELIERTVEQLKKWYPRWGQTDSGAPMLYGIDKAVTGTGNTRLYVMPPVDAGGEIVVEGLFYARELLTDEDTSYWSEMYPNVLVMAALRELEVFYRNTQGLKDWENAIQSELHAFEMDLVERETADATQMEG